MTLKRTIYIPVGKKIPRWIKYILNDIVMFLIGFLVAIRFF